MLIGVISDTHGLLDQKVEERFAGVDLILHGGDVGGRDILERLSGSAPVCAVRGNVDDRECSSLPESLLITVGGAHIYMTHIFTPCRDGIVGDDAHGARVVKGGDYQSHWHDVRSAARRFGAPHESDRTRGFRCARDAE